MQYAIWALLVCCIGLQIQVIYLRRANTRLLNRIVEIAALLEETTSLQFHLGRQVNALANRR